MKTVVITGSARGLGYNIAINFAGHGYNVVLSDLNEDRLKEAKEKILEIVPDANIRYKVCNVVNIDELQALIDYAVSEYKTVDIWINNAGVNQPLKPLWELSKSEIDTVFDVDLKGTVYGSKVAMEQMIKQKSGAIYNIEGYGSNDAHMLGLNMYGTSKRAITYFTEALAQENDELNTGVIVGKLSPGIMITDFTTHSLGKDKIELPEKTKKVYNILGDKPDVVAKFLVDKMINNTKNNVKFNWLPNSKAFIRFMSAGFNKRDFFSEDTKLLKEENNSKNNK